jgi:hypothetical protein
MTEIRLSNYAFSVTYFPLADGAVWGRERRGEPARNRFLSLQACYNVGHRLEKIISKQQGIVFQKDDPVPKVNYKHEKRQRELDKKKKKAQKIKEKEIKKNIKPEENPVPPSET